MIQYIEHLLCTCEDLRVGVQHPQKVPGVVACACTPAREDPGSSLSKSLQVQ